MEDAVYGIDPSQDSTVEEEPVGGIGASPTLAVQNLFFVSSAYKTKMIGKGVTK